MHFYTHNIGEFATKTRFLSPEEVGIYVILKDEYFANGMRIACDRIATLMPPECERSLQRVLRRFFVEIEGYYVCEEFEEELASYKDRRSINAENAKKRWEKKRLASKPDANLCESDAICNDADAKRCLTNNQEPITNISTVQSNDCTREKNFFTLDSEPNADLKKQNCPTSEIVEIFNEVLAPELGRVKKLTSTRAQLVRARWHDVIDVTESKTRADALAGVKAYFEKVGRSDFLMGRLRDATWKADFDWLIKSENFVKVFENRYQNGR